MSKVIHKPRCDKSRKRWYGTTEWGVKVLKKNKQQTLVETESKLQLTIKPSRHGKGCFTTTELKKNTFIGVYPGIILNEKQFTMKMSRVPLQQQENVMRYVVQNRLHSTADNKCYLDPTNPHGTLDAGWRDNPVLYINEPDPDQQTNVISVWNYDTMRLEIWTLRDVAAETELLVHYGDSYNRSYSIAQGQVAAAWIMRNGQLLTV